MRGDCRCNQPEKPPKADQLERLLNTALCLFGYFVNHMPLGSLFCYQILSNVTCFNKTLMAIFVTGCGLGCFLSCFTDMEEAGANNNNIGSVRYGFVTICCVSVNDLVHAVSSTILFAAVALTDQNSIDAFYPCKMSVGIRWFVRWVLIMATFVNGWAVLQWPTNRRGLGFFATFVFNRFDIACGFDPRLMQSCKNAAQQEKSNSSTSELHQVD